MIHLHKIDGDTTEFHRAHPTDEPPVIWQHIRVPVWRNRPFRDPCCAITGSCCYRWRLGLRPALTGFPLQATRNGFGHDRQACFAIAYVAGGWFATQDVWHALKRGKIDIQFLMIAVALGALFVKGMDGGATLLFLFSLSNALEQFANYRTRKSIESLLEGRCRNTPCGVKTVAG